MARRKSLAELQAELDSANGYIEALEAKLDDIAGIVTTDEDDDGCDNEEDIGEDEDYPGPPNYDYEEEEDDDDRDEGNGDDDCRDSDYAYASN